VEAVIKAAQTRQTEDDLQLTTNPIVATQAPVFRRQEPLDRICERLRTGNISSTLDELFDDLARRREEDPGEWSEYVRFCSQHPVRNLLHADPFTYRACAKPRGYAGDAVMMDYVYGLGEAGAAADAATPLGRAIFEYIAALPSAKAVRYRRQLIAGLIDDAARCAGSSVLAIAAGHLRELELASAIGNGNLAEFVAFDQDEASLDVVRRDYSHLGVTVQPGSVRHILGGKTKLGQYDLVYAAGLFDYLTAPVAVALTRRMFDMTRPGGRLLIPNFLTGIPDAGYMEAFMDWSLIYRNHDEMYQLAAALPVLQVADVQVFNDPDYNIAFLLVAKSKW
jgi:extracellular factor (EF) 3-hydroxypalmitic acid methyl ester biosynthesis protein